VESQAKKEKPRTLSNRVRSLTSGLLNRLGMAVHRMGVHPDAVTAFGLIMVALGAFLIAQGRMQQAAIVLIFALSFDALDGAVARAMQRTGKFGALLDSTLDRYADGFIFAALSYHFAVNDRFDMMLLAQVALIGSLLVSYIRGRAGGLQVDCEVGFFTRMERIVVILVMLIIPVLLDWGVLLLAIGTNVTAMQRLWYVYQSLKNRGE
jgi:CDP-diacylglycerol--glycerol-3-phosphate 3-phosphatidyltransferase